MVDSGEGGSSDRTAGELDALLAPAGYHCIHHAAWPGNPAPDVDHVVIGPGGSFAIVERRLAYEVRAGSDGRLWSGGRPLEADLDDALSDAAAVAGVLGGHVTAVLAIHGAEVKTPPVVRTVHLAEASAVPALVARHVAFRSNAETTNLAGRARARVSGGTWVEPVAPDPRRPATASGAPVELAPAEADAEGEEFTVPRRSPGRAFARFAISAAVLAIAAYAVFVFFISEIPGVDRRVLATRSFTEAGVRVASSYECDSGRLNHVVAVDGGKISSAERAESNDGPWAPMVLTLKGAESRGVASDEPAWVRVQGVGVNGEPLRSTFSSPAPAEDC